MIAADNDYGIYLYTGRVDMRKGIDGLCGVIRQDMGRGADLNYVRIIIRYPERYEEHVFDNNVLGQAF